MRRALQTLLLTVAYVAVLAQVAIAETDVGHDGGEGWVGESNDKIVTNFGFVLIIFFPLFILLASMLQWKLDKRKDQRKKAAKARSASRRWQGGW